MNIIFFTVSGPKAICASGSPVDDAGNVNDVKYPFGNFVVIEMSTSTN